jgi:hypothetical protein
VTQRARNIPTTLSEEGKRPQILIRDRDVKLTESFDTFLRSEGITVIPRRSPHRRRTHMPSAGSAASGANVSTES